MTYHEIKTGFHDEWITRGPHRIHVSVRDGFPSQYEIGIADLCARLLIERSEEWPETRLVSVFHDDTHSQIIIRAGTDRNEDIGPAKVALNALVKLFWPTVQILVFVDLVKKGYRQSDHYDHAAYIVGSFYRS